jgi:hypothetical protein
MKLSHLIFIATFILIFAGCAKNDFFAEKENLPELRKAKVPIPFKAELCAVPDMESSLILKPIPGLDPTDPKSYVTSRMIISGTGTHLGRVVSEESFYRIEMFKMIFEAGVPFMYQTGVGHMVAANGDSYDYTWWAKASLPNLDYIGGIEVTSGTGKFKGCSGSADMTGKIDEVNLTNRWTAEGTMEFK